ncbi:MULTISPECIES: toprim domain-containing protein [unclassified Paraburkholderia]|uniref:toprim domain-containing protein n=1 Tax=unclassified Paraburkholderia TaxID=2615204 RepID=UPI002AAF1CB2|nr:MULTISPECIES: toprim domain-containing protein [unclassified Paraburkholderia]
MNDSQEKVDLESVDWRNVLPYYVQDENTLSGRWGACPFCTGSSTFRIIWERRGKGGSGWYCAKCETGGNLISVIHEVTGKPIGEIYYELRTKRYNQGMAPAIVVPKVTSRPVRNPEELRSELRATWESSLAITAASPVWSYFSNRIPGLRAEWLGPDIRYHQGLPYYLDGKFKGKYPVFLQRLVAAGDKLARTLQRCYLTAEGEKVPFVDSKGKSAAKKQMSSPDGPAGGSTRLNNAVSRTLALTEGAENGLAVVAKHENKIEVRSLLDCNNLSNADIDWGRYDTILIYADRDREQEKRATKGTGGEERVIRIRPGEHHADLLAAKLRAMGKRVVIIASVQEGVDFCDIWKLQYERRTKRLADRAVRLEQKERLREQTKSFRRAA